MNSEGKHTGHLSPDTIREYLGGKLSGASMHRVEMHLLECEFCADAVEGFELSERSQVKTELALLALRKKLNEKIKEHERPRIIRWPAWSAAAAGIALAVAGYVVIKQQEEEERLLAVQQSRAFLQTGANDTLIIFMPEEPEPVSSDRLLASNTRGTPPGQSPGFDSPALQAETAVEAPPVAGDTPQAAIARESATGARAAAEQEELAKAAPANQDVAIAAVQNTQDTDVVAIGAPAQRKAARTGSVDIMDTTQGSLAGRQDSRGAGQDSPAGEVKLVRGRVVAGDTASLPGVSVQVAGTVKGTSTDKQGNFTLEVPEDKNSLVVSMLGFKTDTVRINESADYLLLAMQPAERGLDESVVVGYSGKKMKTQVRATPAIGDAAYEKYLADSLRYPGEALEKRVEGEVVVRFTVRPSGRPSAFKIVNSLGHGCDKEAIRLIEEGPDWVTPVMKGRRQPARAVQTVKFELPAGE